MEMGGSSTGTPPDFNRYNEMAVGTLQMSVDTFAGTQGVHLGDERFSVGLAKKYMLFEDLEEIVQDAVSVLHTKVLAVLPTTRIQHRFAYRLLPTGNVLIGLDPREFDHEQDCDGTVGETPSDLQTDGF